MVPVALVLGVEHGLDDVLGYPFERYRQPVLLGVEGGQHAAVPRVDNRAGGEGLQVDEGVVPGAAGGEEVAHLRSEQEKGTSQADPGQHHSNEQPRQRTHGTPRG